MREIFRVLMGLLCVLCLTACSTISAVRHNRAEADYLKVSYGKDTVTSYRQNFPLTIDKKEIKPSDFGPTAWNVDFQFHYTYLFTQDTALQDLPLSMSYHDANDEGFLGSGWQVLYAFTFNKKVQLNIISPEIDVFQKGGRWILRFIKGQGIAF